MSPACWSSIAAIAVSPRPPVAGVLVVRRTPHRAPPLARAPRRAGRRPAVPSPTARRSSTTTFRAWPTSIRRSSAPCARPRPTPRRRRRVRRRQRLALAATTRSSCSARRSRSTAREAEAARWVATPDTSAHVSGDAVDIGPPTPRRGCPQHGAAYGLCQIYGNEPWHYELRPEAVGRRLPARCTPTRRTIQGCSSENACRRAGPDRPDRRGLRLERACRDRHRARATATATARSSARGTRR